MTDMADFLTEYYPPDDTPTPEDSPQCLGWGAKRGKCLNFARSDSSLCRECGDRAADESTRRVSYYDGDGLTRADRIADGELTPEDAEWRAGQAEERKDLEEDR